MVRPPVQDHAAAGPADQSGEDLLRDEGQGDVEQQQHQVIGPAPVAVDEAGRAAEVGGAEALGPRHDVDDLEQRQQRGRLDQQHPDVAEAGQGVDPHLADMDAPEHLPAGHAVGPRRLELPARHRAQGAVDHVGGEGAVDDAERDGGQQQVAEAVEVEVGRVQGGHWPARIATSLGSQTCEARISSRSCSKASGKNRKKRTSGMPRTELMYAGGKQPGRGEGRRCERRPRSARGAARSPRRATAANSVNCTLANHCRCLPLVK